AVTSRTAPAALRNSSGRHMPNFRASGRPPQHHPQNRRRIRERDRLRIVLSSGVKVYTVGVAHTAWLRVPTRLARRPEEFHLRALLEYAVADRDQLGSSLTAGETLSAKWITPIRQSFLIANSHVGH